MSTTAQKSSVVTPLNDCPIDEIAFSKLLEEIKGRRAEFKEQRHISQDIIEKLQTIGLYGAFVPKQLGGDPISPTEFMKLIERISIADGSTKS